MFRRGCAPTAPLPGAGDGSDGVVQEFLLQAEDLEQLLVPLGLQGLDVLVGVVVEAVAGLDAQLAPVHHLLQNVGDGLVSGGWGIS